MKYLRRIKKPFNRFLVSALLFTVYIVQRIINNVQPFHWVHRRPPRLVFLIPYVFILYTVTATTILIATRNMTIAIYLFSAFVVPLYFIVTKSRIRKQSF